MGEVHPEVQKNFGIGTRAYLAVVDMKVVSSLADFDVKYEGCCQVPRQ